MKVGTPIAVLDHMKVSCAVLCRIAVGISGLGCLLSVFGCGGASAEVDHISEVEVERIEAERARCNAASDCDLDFGSAAELNDFRQTREFLLGVWRSCTALEGATRIEAVFQRHEGIEFLPDGRFRLMYFDDKGQLQPRPGLDYEGSVVEGLNGSKSLFLEFDSGARPQQLLAGSDCPRRLRLTVPSGPVLEYSGG